MLFAFVQHYHEHWSAQTLTASWLNFVREHGVQILISLNPFIAAGAFETAAGASVTEGAILKRARRAELAHN